MNINTLINTMNDTNLSLNERTDAASRLWETQSRLNKQLKSFKSELSDLAQDYDQDLFIQSTSGKYVTRIEKQPPTPKLESLDVEIIKDGLGEDMFNQYIAHSYTIKWSEFRDAPQEVKDRFYNLTDVEMTQTYQVKFKRK